MLFYFPHIIAGDVFILPAEEAKHLTVVLRKKEGDLVSFTDGLGSFYSCKLHISGKEVHLEPELVQTLPRPSPALHLIIAPLKHAERTEWFVEKAVEIGISIISLAECEHSERTHVRLDRLERVAISAMKQRLGNWLPEIHGVRPLADILNDPFSGQNFLAHCDESIERQPLVTMIHPGEPARIAIGPEGDFSEKEISLAKQRGFMGVSLGKSRLRTETAGIVAVHTFALKNL